jgi:EmrB/QacA subfamily drug resistance transporter
VPELSRRRRLLVLAVCCMSLMIASMDNTIVNVALPAIRADFDASLPGLQWTVDAYLLVLAGLLMLSGSIADRIGRRRTFQTGLVVFTLGSLLCSIAPGLGWLIAFRAVQAIGGSMLNPVAMSIITNVFTDRRERAMAIGIWGSVVGVSLGLGPIVGGVLTDSVGWRAIFWVNVPIGIAAIVLAALFIPESKAARARHIDLPGQLLVMVGLVAVTYAVIEAPRAGWASAQTFTLLAVGGLAAAALYAVESRRTDPLLDPRFFRSAPFTGATILAVCGFSAFAGYLFLNTLYLQDVRGLSPLMAGVCTLPMAAVTAILSPVSGRLVGTRGPRLSLVAASLGVTIAGAMLLGLTGDTPLAWLIASYVVFAIGFGMLNPPITNTAVSGMPDNQAGVAAALASTSRQVGAALGVAVLGSVLNSGLHGSFRDGFAVASRPAWAIVTGLGLALLVVGLVTSGPWARRTAARIGPLFEADELAAAAVVGPGPMLPTGPG